MIKFLREDSDLSLCWVRVASEPFFGKLFISTSSGFKMGFVNGLKWVQSGSKVGFGVQKWVKMRQNPLLHPLETHFGISTKTHFLPSSRGVEIVFQKGP